MPNFFEASYVSLFSLFLAIFEQLKLLKLPQQSSIYDLRYRLTDPKERRVFLKYLYQENFGKVKQYVINNQGAAQDAEDIFQEGVSVFYLAVLNNSFQEASSIGTYLYAICKNKWLKQLRRRKVSLVHDHNDEIEMQETHVTYDRHQLMTLLANLDTTCKEFLVDFYYLKMSMSELKDKFQLKTAQLAKNKKSKCMKKLISFVKEKRMTLDQFMN